MPDSLWGPFCGTRHTRQSICRLPLYLVLSPRFALWSELSVDAV